MSEFVKMLCEVVIKAEPAEYVMKPGDDSLGFQVLACNAGVEWNYDQDVPSVMRLYPQHDWKKLCVELSEKDVTSFEDEQLDNESFLVEL